MEPSAGQSSNHITSDASVILANIDDNGFTPSDHAMMLTLNSEASIIQNAFGEFDKLGFDPAVNLSHARFVWAAMVGNFDALKSHIENGLPDRIKTLALHETLALWKYECCQLLLDHGADPDGRGIDGTTPLTVAAFQLEADIAGLLHSCGADLELGNLWGQRPLFCVCQGGIGDSPEDLPEQKRLNMAKLLLGRGADVEGADNEDRTPLCQAVIAVNDIELARLLIQHGANPDKEDIYCVTPLQLAEQNCSSEMVELLREYSVTLLP